MTQFMKRNLIFLSMLLALVLPACGAAAPEIAPDADVDLLPTEVAFVTVAPPTATPTFTPLPPTPKPLPTATATKTEPPAGVATVNTPTLEPEPTVADTPTSEPSSTPEPDWLNNYGRTADNLVYLGNPDAPVALIDFSDFM
jgi:hypothetical protein